MARRVVTPKGRAVRLIGLNKVYEQMEAVINRTTAPEVKRIYMGAALVLRDEARDLAPLLKKATKGHVPGLLKKAIFAAYGDPSKASVIVGVNYKIAPHAHMIEFGTGPRTDSKGHNRGSVPAQPFMRPALTASRTKCVAIITEGLRNLIEKAS